MTFTDEDLNRLKVSPWLRNCLAEAIHQEYFERMVSYPYNYKTAWDADSYNRRLHTEIAQRIMAILKEKGFDKDALLARLEAAEAYRECAKHLLEVLISYKRYTPESYKQNPIYIIGSNEAEEEYRRIDEIWRKVAGK